MGGKIQKLIAYFISFFEDTYEDQKIFLLKQFGQNIDVPTIRSKQNGRNRKGNPIPCLDIETEKSSSGTLNSSGKSTHERCVFTTFFISKLFHEIFKKFYLIFRNRKGNPIHCLDIETEKLKSPGKSTHQRCVFTTFFISKLFHDIFKKSNAGICHWNIIRLQNLF